MKRLLYCCAYLTVFIVLTSSSCKQQDDNPSPSGPDSTTTTSATGSGWKVSKFTEPGENKTSDYSGYSFEFASNGSMKATRSSQTTSGTWRQHQDDGVTKFEIALSTSDHDLAELNDDWVLVNKSNSLISLKDDNAANNEQLQFSK